MDEQGTPLAGVQWWVSATEEFRDGDWGLVLKLGLTARNTTDEGGDFVLTFQGRVRHDLQFEKAGFAPAFLFQVSAQASPPEVVMRRGHAICGTVVRLAKENREPVHGAAVELRLPTRDWWYTTQTITDDLGRFEFRVCPPPARPVDCTGKTCRQGTRRWQVVYAGEVVEVDIREGVPVEPVCFEVQVRVTRPAQTHP